MCSCSGAAVAYSQPRRPAYRVTCACVPTSQVNLLPSEEPQDVYAGVRSLVADKVAGDAKEGDPLATKLVGLITRKVVKQTVMTSVYGVTFIGAKRQVENRCAVQHTMAEACSLLTAHYLLLTTYCSLLPTPYSLLPTPYYSLLPTPYSLQAVRAG